MVQEDRQYPLVKGLEHINDEIEGAAREGVACWFPMGTRDERILRLPAREAILLNSRCFVLGLFGIQQHVWPQSEMSWPADFLLAYAILRLPVREAILLCSRCLPCM